MINKQKQGKRNKASGARFELLVRKDLESKGWVCSKWMNNVGMWDKKGNQVIKKTINKSEKYLVKKTQKEIKFEDIIFDKIISAKHKFRGIGIPMAIGTGFCDFIIYRQRVLSNYEKEMPNNLYEIIFCEAKSKGYLDKEEKEKALWYLKNNFCSKFLIAKKTKKGRKVIVKYKEFEK